GVRRRSVRGTLLDRCRRHAPGVVARVAQHRRPQGRHGAGVLCREAHEPRRIRVRQRTQEHAVDHREHGRRRTDAERERQQPGRRKALVSPQRRERVADVSEQRVHTEGLYSNDGTPEAVPYRCHMARRGFAILFTLLGIAVFISMVGFTLLYLAFGREPSVPTNATLVLKVGGSLAEMAPNDVVGYLRGTRTPTVRGLVDNLRKAKVDTRVKSVLLKPTGFEAPFWGSVQGIRDAVLDFRKSGKPIYAYVEYGGDREYYLATAADKVFLIPSAPLDLTGVATYELFLRGTLDKIGVYPDLHRIGDYKTAVNTFKEKGFTSAHKEMDESMNRDLYAQILRGIADGRKKNEAEIRRLLDEGPFLPEEALRAGLVDDVAYEDQVDDKLRAGEKRSHLDTDDYARVSLSSVGLNRGPRVAVIYATGTINSGKSGYDPLNGPLAGSETLIEYIRQARRDSSVRAIVLRVDSPGGSVAASEAIWREMMITKQERADRPIVVSMSDLAASGGYYIAMPAHVIVAQPSTLTGSI